MVYSIDFREKVITVYEKKKSLRKTAELLEVSYTFVQDMVSRRKAGESLAPKPHKSGNHPKIQDVHIPFLIDMIEKENDLTLEEMCRRLYKKFNLKTGVSTLHDTPERLKITRKKNFRDPAASKEKNLFKTVNYLALLFESKKKDFIFLDETGCCLNMSREFARSPKGERAFSEKPSGRGKRISIIGAVKFGRMIKSMKFKGTLNGSIFYSYIKKFLLPHIDDSTTVVLDNASPHKNKDALDLIRITGAKVLFLPPYRPELNPIEYCWSIMKNNIRKMQPRTEEELMISYDVSLKKVTSKAIKSFFHHCWV